MEDLLFGFALVSTDAVGVGVAGPQGRPNPAVSYIDSSRSASSVGRARNGQWSPGSSTSSARPGTSALAQSVSMIRSSVQST